MAALVLLAALPREPFQWVQRQIERAAAPSGEHLHTSEVTNAFRAIKAARRMHLGCAAQRVIGANEPRRQAVTSKGQS